MLKTKYIPQENADLMLRILEKVKANYESIRFYVVESEEAECIYYGRNPENAISEMDGIDCEGFGVNCYNGSKADGDNHLGWFYFTPYEDDVDCVLCDMNDNDFCKEMSNG